jgi:hypothetical protein
VSVGLLQATVVQTVGLPVCVIVVAVVRGLLVKGRTGAAGIPMGLTMVVRDVR